MKTFIITLSHTRTCAVCRTRIDRFSSIEVYQRSPICVLHLQTLVSSRSYNIIIIYMTLNMSSLLDLNELVHQLHVIIYCSMCKSLVEPRPPRVDIESSGCMSSSANYWHMYIVQYMFNLPKETDYRR